MSLRHALAFLILLLLGARHAVAGDGNAPLQEDIQALQAQIDLENQRLQALDTTESSFFSVEKAVSLGRFSNPKVEASLSTEVQDIDAFGVVADHGTAIVELLNLKISAQLDAAQIEFEFHPSVSPAVTNNQGYGVATDNQPLMAAVPFAGTTPPGTLFDRAKLTVSWAGLVPSQLSLGFSEFNYSPYVLSGPIYSRPDYFDPDPSDGRNEPNRTTWRQRFGTVGYQVSADSGEHQFMGLMDEIKLPEELTLNLFSGINEYYYLDGNAIHESGARLQINSWTADGSMFNLLFVNQANDLGEIKAVGVVGPEDPVNGLQNSSASSFQYTQNIGASVFQSELAYAFDNTPIQTSQGLAWQASLNVPMGPLQLGLQGGYTAPNYIVRAGDDNDTAMNRVSGTADPLNPQSTLYDTVISSPTAPMNNTTDWGASAHLLLGFVTLNAQLLNHSQVEASSPVIESSHFLNGNNVTGNGWWALFNNNYTAWVPSPTNDVTNANANENNYNRLYLPASGTETDAAGRSYGAAYHELETDLFSSNRERLLTSDAAGQPLLPSQKNISYASCDARFNLGDEFSMNREVYLQLFQDFESVNDATLAAPSMDPNNLFNQDVSQIMLVYGLFPTVYYLLTAGYETWTGDRFATSYVDAIDGQTRTARLEYYERSVGIGLDWEVSPNKVYALIRLKAFDHDDAANSENNFMARQMLWELQAWF